MENMDKKRYAYNVVDWNNKVIESGYWYCSEYEAATRAKDYVAKPGIFSADFTISDLF